MSTHETDRADALSKLIYESVRFAIWASGEGISPAAGEPTENPEEFVYEYVTRTGDEDVDTLADRAVAVCRRTPPAAVPDRLEDIPDYDAGLISDWGGGNVNWWQDYLRAEIGRANDYWRDALYSEPAVETHPLPTTAIVHHETETVKGDAPAAVPDGWVMVPATPTPEMLRAWYRYKSGFRFPDEQPATDTSDYGAYRSMISAAPAAPTEGSDE